MEGKRTKNKLLRVRLTEEEMTRLEEAAAERSTTLSDWARETLLESVRVTPQERRITTCVTAAGLRVLLTMEEWQQGKDLSLEEVKARVVRLAEQALREQGDGV